MKKRKVESAFEERANRTQVGGPNWNSFQKDLKDKIKGYMQMHKEYPQYGGYIDRAFGVS